jgi:hypothetical protein
MRGCNPARRTLARFGGDPRTPAMLRAAARAALARQAVGVEDPQRARNRAIHDRIKNDAGCVRFWTMNASAGRDARAIASRDEAK